ncbi:conserved hypothetical protein [Candidatus Zixiibacteriota bacterium]|nr:conserved hypothetical protein [candidate division Zixibacteria bacterium]
MKFKFPLCIICGLFTILFVSLGPSLVTARDLGVPISLQFRISLPGVEGRIDHMAIDSRHRRLFVAALGNNSVEIIDLETKSDIKSLKGFREPQGVLYINELDKLFVTEGGSGLIRIFQGDPLTMVDSISLGSDADNIRYDSAARKVYVGYGSGGLAVIDPVTDRLLYKISLKGHPESFQIDPAANLAYVNIPDAYEIAVVNLNDGSILKQLRNLAADGNYPMALDPENHQLLVGFRDPPTFAILDSQNGTAIVSIPIDRDPDDIFLDSESHLVFISSGAGVLQIMDQMTVADDSALVKIATAAGARTCFLDQSGARLFIAVPHRGRQLAEIWVYKLTRP